MSNNREEEIRRRAYELGTRQGQPCAVGHSGLVNMTRKSSSAHFRPSSVKTTDLALFTGSAIMPLSWSRLRASQSKPFHARQWS